jgi:hypothetical protein
MLQKLFEKLKNFLKFYKNKSIIEHSMQKLIIYENLIAMTAFRVAACLLISAPIVHLIYRLGKKRAQ